jgi:hypothetical protein
MNKKSLSFITTVLSVLLFAWSAAAQSTSFSYQGSLESSGNPASGNHDFEFALFDVPAGGTQLGSVFSLNNVAVTNGIFSVQLDFGNQFSGANRFLEIRVKPAGQPAFTTLTPRQPIDSSPYAIKSLNADIAATATNATQLGGVAASQYVITTDPRMTDARNPLPGSTNYIWNQNSVLQPSSNFIISGNGFIGGLLEAGAVNISGNGTVGGTLSAGAVNISGNGTVGGTLSANAVNTSTNYRIGGVTVLSIAGLAANTFVGDGAGTANLATFNTFVGRSAGAANTSGGSNSFFGANAGLNTTTGISNSYFGSSAGSQNITGENNAFFGSAAGSQGNTGSNNSFFGWRAGRLNSGSSNAFFGAGTGDSNTTGVNNAFFGANAGAANTTALGNSFFGANAGAANITAMGNSFFGASAGLVNNGANNSFFGTVAGVANTSGFNNAFFGHWAGHDNTNGDNNSFFGRSAGEINTTGNGNTFVGFQAGNTNTTGSNNTTLGNGADVGGTDPISFGTAIGAGSLVTSSNSVVLGRATDNVHVPGSLAVIGSFNVLAEAYFFEPVILTELGSAGNLSLCRNSDEEISTCSSSGRYKTNIVTFDSGLDLISRLRPVSFDWKNGGMHDLGFVAEEVAEIEPLLTTTNTKGEIEGVKYDRVGVVLVNAVKEQQAQIETQTELIKRQQQQIDALMKLVCASHSDAAICREGL